MYHKIASVILLDPGFLWCCESGYVKSWSWSSLKRLRIILGGFRKNSIFCIKNMLLNFVLSKFSQPSRENIQLSVFFPESKSYPISWCTAKNFLQFIIRPWKCLGTIYWQILCCSRAQIPYKFGAVFRFYKICLAFESFNDWTWRRA
jgi:hypothetical protein